MSEKKLFLSERLRRVRNEPQKFSESVSRLYETGIITTKVGFPNAVSSVSGVRLEAAQEDSSLVSKVQSILSNNVLVLNPAYAFSRDLKAGEMDRMPEARIAIFAEEANILADLWGDNREMELMTILERLVQAYIKTGKAKRAQKEWEERVQEA